MSNIYIQEPPALGKVLLKTTVGDIDLELWTKEAPKACKNFIQLCMEGYYNGTIFHRVVPDFIVQGGDPNGDGTGGESIYGQPFKDEFHTRLRFNRRGLVAMANAGKDDNSSQFFFTLNSTPELQNKHTIFGKVTGETIYNVLKLAEGEIDHEERPLYPHKITGSQVLVNPFEDIVPRIVQKPKENVEEKKKKKEKGVKNFGLLSFGMEAEEDEDQSTEYRGKPKSTHDLLDDPKLSKLTAIEGDIDDEKLDETIPSDSKNEDVQITLESIKDKLKSKKKKVVVNDVEEDVKSDEEIESYYLGKDKKEARKKQAEEIREQIRDLKKEMISQKRMKDAEKIIPVEIEKPKPKPLNEFVEHYESEQEKYKKLMEQIPKKGASRETQKKMQEEKPWVKKLYENTGIYPDNYTDKKFLEEMKKNINIYNVSFSESILGSCRITQKLSACILFSTIFSYLYNEWTSAEFVFGMSSLFTFSGYFLFLLVDKRKETQHENEQCNSLHPNIEKLETRDCAKETSSSKNTVNDDESYVNHLFKLSIEKKSRKLKKKEELIYADKNHQTAKDNRASKASFTFRVLNDFKTVLIYIFFGYLFSPILHTLTDTVSTDTIFATTIFMMIVHLIFSDYGISVAVVSNSLSINCAIFGSICLASRLSTPFCAFVLMTVAIQVFVLSPILIKLIWDSNYAVFMFCASILVSFYFLWVVSKTLFFFYLIAVLFLNVYCPYLFVKWQNYKDNIYGPWDEAIVHDSDDVEDLII